MAGSTSRNKNIANKEKTWSFKGALCSFQRWTRYALDKLNKQTLCFHDRINKPTLKDNTIPFTLFICGGPCHLSSFKQC